MMSFGRTGKSTARSVMGRRPLDDYGVAMSSFIPIALAGALFGAGAGLLLLVQGRIAGISGITAGVLAPRRGDVAWRVLFVCGLLAGGALAGLLVPDSIARHHALPLLQLIAAGLLIGLGASLGNGCTSGHGVCGVGRLSLRSIVAVATFTLVGALVEGSMR
jgi:uncharacterized membrane protein YedE/YeeE